MTTALHRLTALLLIGLAAGSVRSAIAQGVTAQPSFYRELQRQAV
jgi:hypothetical protein